MASRALSLALGPFVWQEARQESWQVPYLRAAGNQPGFYSSSSHKLTDRCEKTEGSNTETPAGQDGTERWVMPLGLHLQTTVTANNHPKM